jgi:hypothetical protein
LDGQAIAACGARRPDGGHADARAELTDDLVEARAFGARDHRSMLTVCAP